MKAANEGNAVACVIVTYNAAQWLQRCLESVLASSIPVEIIVVDNASSDETMQIAASFGAPVTLLAQSANLGFGRANNLGISYALQHTVDYVFLLNQDTHVDPEALGTLVSAMRSDSQYGILSPMHWNRDGTAIDKNFLNYIKDYSDRSHYADRHFGRHEKTIYKIDYVNAAAWLLSKECLLKVGGFDPLFFMYGEDDDLCQRALRHGFKIGFVPDANIYHYRESSPASGSFYEQLRAASQKPYSEMVLHLKSTSSFSAFLKRMVGELFRRGIYILQLALTGRFRSALVNALAVVRGLKNLPSIWQHRQLDRTPGAHWLSVTGGK
jgi:GT2 family glycosyltransferase